MPSADLPIETVTAALEIAASPAVTDTVIASASSVEITADCGAATISGLLTIVGVGVGDVAAQVAGDTPSTHASVTAITATARRTIARRSKRSRERAKGAVAVMSWVSVHGGPPSGGRPAGILRFPASWTLQAVRG
ncbi:hypothetical protein GCM10009808_21310 [Microbacterium sediminicola]|uniref:Uncharacterized protein n=1 Tax=Microbacterium sediminicola TaxID=415210 RepID=A0ABN2IDQ9_9MICO